MASIYKRDAIWWVKWRNPATNKRVRFSTGIRVGGVRERSHAIRIRNEFALKESSRDGSLITHHPFHQWVPDYLKTHRARTYTRYCSLWQALSCYLDERKVTAPAQVTREMCLAYTGWRQDVPHFNGRKPVSINTAILELKLLAKILSEAVNRGWLIANPCTRLKLKRDPARPKDELSDEQVKIIQAEIARRIASAETREEKDTAHFLRVSFEIARFQGIRMAETCICLDDVDLHRLTMIVHGKGGRREEVNMNPKLVPLFQELRATGRTHTFTMPHLPMLKWFKVFKTLRHQHPDFRRVSFHSTRISVISRMERAGAPEAVIMKTVLHSSTTVHRVYRKVKQQELAPYWAALDPSSDKPK